MPSRTGTERPKEGRDFSKLFGDIANRTSHAAGKALTFLGAAGVVVVWAITGPLFQFSDTWQLVINTGTTIVTFLMVFLIQNSQNRDSAAIQVKLDEIGSEYPEHADFVSQMRSLVDRFDLDQYMATLKTLHAYDH